MDRVRDSHALAVYVPLAIGIAMSVYALPRYDVLKKFVAVRSAAILAVFPFPRTGGHPWRCAGAPRTGILRSSRRESIPKVRFPVLDSPYWIHRAI